MYGTTTIPDRSFSVSDVYARFLARTLTVLAFVHVWVSLGLGSLPLMEKLRFVPVHTRYITHERVMAKYESMPRIVAYISLQDKLSYAFTSFPETLVTLFTTPPLASYAVGLVAVTAWLAALSYCWEVLR